MSASMEVMPPGGHETYATSIFSKIKTYLDSNPYKPVKDIPNTPTAIATFDDGSDLPMPKLEVAIEPQQEGSGDPSPENIRPIIGHTEVNVSVCGKNVFGGLPMAENIVEVGRNATLDTTNKTVTFTISTKDGSYDRSISEGFKFKENTIYTFVATYSNSGKNGSLRFRSTTGTHQEIQLANTNGQKTKIAVTTWRDYSLKDIILSYYAAGSTTLYYEESGIFEGVLTADDFEPYNGHTYTIDLDGTRYGGTLDVVSGELVVDRVEVDLGSLTWTTLASGRHSAFISDGKFAPTNTDIANALSSQYKVTSATDIPNIDSSFCYGANGVANLLVNDSRYNGEDASDFKTHMSGIQVVYELATPTIIQLTPTQVKSLLGQNNVWADTGDIKDGKYVVQDYSDITSKVSEFAQHAITASKLGSSNVGSATQPIYLNGGTATACTYTLGKSVPSDAVFTDTKVTQTATDVSSNAEYEVLFSGTADDTTRTEGTRKTSLFTFNPQTNEVAAGHFAAKTDSPSGNKTANLLGYDIQLGGTSNTWDGTHTSLKDTITYLNSHFAPSAHDHTYITSAGSNTQSTSSKAYALGAFNVRWFSENGKLPGQPTQYGFLLTTATGTNADENHQIFMSQANGDLYHRGTNASSSSNPPAFKKILDSSNYTSYTRNSSGVIKVKSVNKTPTNAGTSLASPTPSIDTGYKFLCWLYVQSNGYIVGANYPGGAANPSATWWFANGYLANYGLTFYYLEIKDTI